MKEIRLITEDPIDLSQDHAWHTAIRMQALERLTTTRRRRPRYPLSAVLAVLVALHGLMFWRWYASRFPMPPSQPTIVQVRLIDESIPPPPVPPHPAMSQRSHRAIGLPPRPVAPPPMAAALLPASPLRPVLFNHDGSVRLAPQARFVPPQEAGVARGRELLARGHNIIHCRRSRFDNSPTATEAATAAARGARMAHLVMGNPLDPLNDVGQPQAEDAAGEHAAEKRRIEEQACDY